ncbi:alpha/beta fold hydrolase [Actinomadura flavalba]|uniref:alpha/beta fold hydrolase n=1 Tax=Actinomadura flavalba TaxID=1120938 RepID=UPI0003A66000|nr:alpha/beta hydrolase [Actinomadura flavalba]
MVSRRRKAGIAGIVAGVGAAGVGAAMGVRHLAVGRVRMRPDPEADEPFGLLSGETVPVTADDGLPLHVEVEGPGDAALAVVFCHGYCLTQHTWHYQRRDLRAAAESGDLRLVFWDQRSHGRSGRSDPLSATIDQTGADLEKVLSAAVPAGMPVLLVGHSMGGMSIMALADRRPELFGDRVVGAILVNTSSGDLREMTLGLPLAVAKMLRPLTPGTLRGLGRRAALVERARAVGGDLAFVITRRMAFADPQISPSVVDFLERMIRATPIDVIAEFYPSLTGHDKLAALNALARVPTVVLVAEADRFTPAEHGRALAKALPGTDLVELADAGHILPLERPADVTDAVRRLITRLRPELEQAVS